MKMPYDSGEIKNLLSGCFICRVIASLTRLQPASAGLLEIPGNELPCQLACQGEVQVTLKSISILANSLFSRQFTSDSAHF